MLIFSLSTTVSLLLLSAMAFTRHQVVTSPASQHRIFRWASKHKFLATLLPWAVGLLITSLHFLDFTHVFSRDEQVGMSLCFLPIAASFIFFFLPS